METIELPSFVGGQVQGQHQAEHSEGTWSELSGVVLEDSGVIRSQYGASGRADIGGRPVSLVEVGDEPTVLVRKDGATWWRAPAEGGTTPTSLDGVLPNAGTALATVPAPRQASVGFRRAALVMTDRTQDAFLWTREGGADIVKGIAERYPNDPSLDGLPQGGVGAMWGDYLVLGDIWWMDDPNTAFDATNERRYPHGLWFSQPGDVLAWDPIDVEFIGLKQQGDEPAIRDLMVHEFGLMVLTDAGTFLLRGTPSSHEFDFVDTTDLEKATFWRGAGGVVGMADGALWFTSPDAQPQEIALPTLDAEAVDVAAWRDHLFVVDDADRLFAARLLPDRGIAWTELLPHGESTGPFGVWASDDGVYVSDSTGWYWLSPLLQRGEWTDSTGVAQQWTARVVSPTLSVGPTVSGLWRSFGAYLRGTGNVTKVESFAGSPSDPDATVTTDVSADPLAVAGRRTAEWPSAGPSHEAGFAFEFTGDVSVEACVAWAYGGGRQERA